MLNNGSDHALSRKIVVNSWNTPYAGGQYNGLGARVGPFRRTNNLGIFKQNGLFMWWSKSSQ